MKIFLTGEKQIGKSTIIDTVIASNLFSISGFRTKKDKDLYMYPASAPFKKFIKVAYFMDNKMIPDTVAFNEYGSYLLQLIDKNDLVIMDELGYLEEDAHKFINSVMDIVNSDINILGVIRSNIPNWTKEIIKKSDVTFISVTPENRDELVNTIIQQYFPTHQ